MSARFPDAAWRRAFELAWASWCRGGGGVGAVVVDERGALRAEGFDDGGLEHAGLEAVRVLRGGEHRPLTLRATQPPCARRNRAPASRPSARPRAAFPRLVHPRLAPPREG